MAYRAGARVIDLEFVQFHPTALRVPGHPRFLLSEALRGEGARLLNEDGEPFMRQYDPGGDLAPRDRVSRAIERETQRTGHPVYLSLQHLDPDFVHARFPLVTDTCRAAGLDLARERIPVGPAAHYLMGGVETDLDGRTSIPGLFAAGEVACTGVHGANRLASNSLLEGLVFGARAGRAMTLGERSRHETGSTAVPRPERAAAAFGIAEHEVQALMWRHAGLFRDEQGLHRALSTLEELWRDLQGRNGPAGALDLGTWRLVSLVTLGRLIVRAALRRTESRGGHYRTDYPERDDIHWKRRVGERRRSSAEF
jgi:L-aspartate oxidase